MSEQNFNRLHDWVEPAHPAVIKLHEDMIVFYRRIREKLQKEIDAAFDRVSRQIGFVVATVLPVTIEVNEKSAIQKITLGADHLKGTLFDTEFAKVLNSLTKMDPDPQPVFPKGTYRIYLFWFDALKLKLRTDWMEPAHFLGARAAAAMKAQSRFALRPEVQEPAHWFHPGVMLEVEEAVLIEAIDSVYPELQLINQIAAYRQLGRKQIVPEVQEPAHLRSVITEKNRDEVITRLRNMLDWLESGK